MKGILTTSIQTETRKDGGDSWTFGPVVKHVQELNVADPVWTSSQCITSVADQWGRPLYVTHIWTEWEALTKR